MIVVEEEEILADDHFRETAATTTEDKETVLNVEEKGISKETALVKEVVVAVIEGEDHTQAIPTETEEDHQGEVEEEMIEEGVIHQTGDQEEIEAIVTTGEDQFLLGEKEDTHLLAPMVEEERAQVVIVAPGKMVHPLQSSKSSQRLQHQSILSE